MKCKTCQGSGKVAAMTYDDSEVVVNSNGNLICDLCIVCDGRGFIPDGTPGECPQCGARVNREGWCPWCHHGRNQGEKP